MSEFPGLVASHFTLSGAGFAEPPRNSFIERCEAAAAAGFSGIGLHCDDLSRTIAAGVDVPEMRAVLRNNGLALVEIEFLAGWAFRSCQSGGISPSLAVIEAVADAAAHGASCSSRHIPTFGWSASYVGWGTIGTVFFEFVERRGGYDGYGIDNAPVRLAAQRA
jgi:hypothetical protein